MYGWYNSIQIYKNEVVRMNNDLKIAVFADGADISSMLKQYKGGIVSGFTTNPSLMKKAGVTDYMAFAKDVVKNIPDMSLSFEVFADDFDTMEKEAEAISRLGENVFVKIPYMNTKYEKTMTLIKRLTEKGIKVNITVVMTDEQAIEAIDSVLGGTKCIVSMFAGRVADTGVDPKPMVKRACEYAKNSGKNIEMLWASCREFYNIVEAQECGCDIITVPDSVLGKFKNYKQDLTELAHDGVMAFAKDIKSLGFSIL